MKASDHDLMMLDAIREAPGLTNWEEDFIESVTDQVLSHGNISDRQQEIIERIYEEKG